MNNGKLTYQSLQNPTLLKMAKWIVIGMLIIGFFHRFIANDLPLLAKHNESITSPIWVELLSDIGVMDDRNYNHNSFEWKIMPVIPYDADQLSSKVNVNIGPFDHQEVASIRYRHWLGTDELGRDVLAGIIKGTNIAMKVGLISIGLALFLGLYLGLLSGYYGDTGWKVSIYQLLAGATVKLMALYYILYPVSPNAGVMYYISVIAGAAILLMLIMRYLTIGPKIQLPIDLIVTKSIEVVKSIPALFIILAFLALFQTPSIWNVILIIALLRWPNFARLIRAEILQIKNLEYIQSAKSIGLSDFKIITQHALPNAMTSIISILAFSISAAILLESTLSFLGIGIPVEHVSWGSMLSTARGNFDAWWLAIFPGLAIFLVLISLYIVGNHLNQKKY